jgi:hypothetical protein
MVVGVVVVGVVVVVVGQLSIRYTGNDQKFVLPNLKKKCSHFLQDNFFQKFCECLHLNLKE